MTTRWIFIVESSLNFPAFVDIIFSIIYSPTYHSISFLASLFLNTRSLILNITLSPLLNFFTSFYSLSACCFISSFLVLSLPLHVPSILFLQISLHFLLLISFIYLLLFLFIFSIKDKTFVVVWVLLFTANSAIVSYSGQSFYLWSIKES